MAEQEPLDPYHKWLGIPPEERPPTHYRLLAISRFESDPDVISHAADRTMAHVRTFQSGPHAATSQRILNELSEARVCLLDVQRKAAYDAKLRADGAPVASPPVPPPAPTAVVVAKPPPTAAVETGTTDGPPVARPVAASGAATLASPVHPAPEVDPARPRSSVAARRGMSRKRSSPAPILIMLLIGGAIVGGFVYALNREPAAPVKNPTAKSQAAGKAAAEKAPKVEDRKDETPTKVAVERPKSDEFRNHPPRPAPRDWSAPASVDEALLMAHYALKHETPAKVEEHLGEAHKLSPTPQDRERMARIHKLAGYFGMFREHLNKAVREIPPGKIFEIEGPERVLELRYNGMTDDERPSLSFTVGFQEHTLAVDQIPAPLAVLIAGTGERSGREMQLAVATYLALGPKANLRHARRLWQRLIDQGQAERSLWEEIEQAQSETSPEPFEFGPD